MSSRFSSARRVWIATAVLALAMASGGVAGSGHGPVAGRGFDVHHPHGLVDVPTDSEQSFAALLAGQPKPDPSGVQGSGGRLVAFRSGGRLVSLRSPGSTRLFRTGMPMFEPTLGIAPDGYVYTNVFKRENLGVQTVLRTRDGSSFQDVGPRVGGQSTHQYTEDPYLYVDPTTGRIFQNDLLFPCQQTSFSSDGGKSWREAAANCDQADHQNIFAGRAPEGGVQPVGYPNVVYDCAINGGATAGISSTITTCDKSLDGGQTFLPTGSPPFVADPAKNNPPGTCDGTTGHGVADQRGRIYLPRGWCGQPYLAISDDEGVSWRRVQVSSKGMDAGPDLKPDILPIFDHEAAVSVDRAGNIYYFWVAYDYKPYLAISRDRGEHWSTPMMIAPPGVSQAVLPALAIAPQADPGRLAVVFMGSTNAPDNPYPHDDAHYRNVEWSAYIVETTTALDRDPVFYGGALNDPSDPLVRGVCGPVRCQAELDFIDVQVSSAGQPWAVFIDACAAEAPCSFQGESVLGTVVGGPRLIGSSTRSR